eukprot:CAMPEP_0113575824 /NCGR_PEP_ID=MMETSP0015_2-20120614/27919_1 /TAXON_ID=2838 /ORGANISM="Odontella" /LENGTH=75 /DNA_ID=CAMNT_0000479119 /DNA_START=54 /DNA_END=281 /DNA_ORIENTATION=- /assembly_acc=CAM_ASM_000160
MKEREREENGGGRGCGPADCCCSMAATCAKETTLRNLAYAMAAANSEEAGWKKSQGDEELMRMKVDMYVEMLRDG